MTISGYTINVFHIQKIGEYEILYVNLQYSSSIDNQQQ